MSFEFYDICDIKVEVMTNYDKVWKFMTIYDWTYDTVGGVQFYAYWVKFDVEKILGKFLKKFSCAI